MQIQEYLNLSMSYFKIGLSFVRDGISKIISLTGLDGTLFTIVLMAILSIWLGTLITKRFVTKPWSGAYCLFTGLISLLWFIILMYL